jgi:hypothetical protein
MTPDELDHQFADVVAAADQALADDGQVDPAYLIIDRSRRAQIVAADHTSPERKYESNKLARLVAVAADAEIVVLRSEAWIVVGDTTLDVPPSKSDRRREVVLVIAVARGDAGGLLTRFSSREIVRGDDGTAIGTQSLHVPDDGGELLGPHGELLRAERPTPAERRAARAILERVTKRLSRGKSAFAGPSDSMY